jgi:hypothetical protein
MMVSIASLVFVLAAICAALMGYAIQRGATCTVAAIGEILHKRKTSRLLALAETSLWVAGGLLTARAIGLLPMLPGGFAVTGWTVVGGVLLGLGAFVNRACVFGAIAQLGSGHLAYILTPIGFYIGAVTTAGLFGAMMPVPIPTLAPGSSLPLWLAPLFLLFAAWRLLSIVRRPHDDGNWAQKVWAPHEATIVIGITFVVMLVGVGAWAYTDLLVQLAHGMANGWIWQITLLFALLVGASIGGWTGGQLGWRRLRLGDMLRCLFGGMLMGWGSLLIPGGNDGLILVGIPFLWPYAWVGIIVMCLTIWVAMTINFRLTKS